MGEWLAEKKGEALVVEVGGDGEVGGGEVVGCDLGEIAADSLRLFQGEGER